MIAPAETAIHARGLTRQFGDLTAVDALDLSVVPGEIFGLVGPDGAGKTTTLRMLAGIMSPNEGEVHVAGCDLIVDPGGGRDRLAYMSQRFGLYPDLTVRENINYYADLYGVSRRDRTGRMEELLEFSRMAPFTGRRAGDLSGGMKQKLQLICALIHTPQVLLLDEPTNGVDPVSRREFWRILYRLLRQDVAILVTTAYLDEAERCNRVGLISEGRPTCRRSTRRDPGSDERKNPEVFTVIRRGPSAVWWPDSYPPPTRRSSETRCMWSVTTWRPPAVP